MKLTKAGMLTYLQQNMEDLNILPLMVVQSNDLYSKEEDVVNSIISFSKGRSLIIRSSSENEDTSMFSNAGKFESLLNVMPEYNEVRVALETVYLSYHTDKNEEILVQPMLQNIKKSGVIFTADMDTFADYYIVNYYEGDNSEVVTSGSSNDLKTFIQYKSSELEVADSYMKSLLEVCAKIEEFLQNSKLDIEFAIDSEDVIYILQVRPLIQRNAEVNEKIDLYPAINRIYKKVKKLSAKHPFLLGDTTCFGVMPDWNPAEILGVRPKKLAISLYKELITDSIWAHQRANYGYRDLTMHPLMISFCGIPYIDTRITFNSFVPAKLNEKIADKLVNYYLDKLAEYPKYHDKIEFEIVFSCYYLGVRDKLKNLLDYGFNENEITRIEFALLELTNRIINPNTGLYKKDIEKIEVLKRNYEKIVDSDISLVDKIYWLIEECKAYGTLPFAGVARAGFIAVQFLKSFVEMGIINKEEYDAYMNSLDTINKQMNTDLKQYQKGQMSREEFLKKYGHIRPGTYDIMSKRYDEAVDEYFSQGVFLDIEKEEASFHFSEAQMQQIQEELEQNGISVSAEELLVFIKEAIEGREYLKFIFTKSVSKILQLVEELGVRADISREDMAYLDISVVKQLYVDLYTGDISSIFRENIYNNKHQYNSAVQIKLPSIIVEPEDVYSFFLLGEEPNYITQKSITGDAIIVRADNADYEGKIVFIQAADPGYDFLFSKKIGGLVTQFGGANSHMAIRCAELGIPAIIGAGEQNFKEWSKCKKLTIDCLKKQVIIIE